MKKVIIASMLLAVSGIAHGMENGGAAVQPKRSLMDRVPSFAKNSCVVAAAVFTALHLAKNGVYCPLAQGAQAPAVAALSALATYKMSQSDNKKVRVGAALPALLTVSALLQK